MTDRHTDGHAVKAITRAGKKESITLLLIVYHVLPDKRRAIKTATGVGLHVSGVLGVAIAPTPPMDPPLTTIAS